MVGISKIKEQIMKAQKVRHPSKANLNNSTVGLSQMEEKYESLLELPSLQSRKALLDSKVKFSEIFRSSPNAIAITTLEDGRFIEVSDSYTQITGYTREEVIGRSSAELGFWVEAEARTRILRMLKEQGRVRREEVHMRIKSGEEHVGLFSSEPIDIDGEPCMLSVVVDITELKRAEEALQTTLKTALDGFWRTNLEGKLLEVNDSYCKMVGYTREELLKMSIPEIEYVESPKEVTQRIKRIAEQGYDRFETRHKRKDGSIIDVEISVNYLGLGEGQFFVFARDITERKRAEEALKLRAQILDSATDSIFLHDFDGNFVYVNETACRTHGYSREEFMKMKLTQVIAPERVSRLDSDFQEMLEKGQVIFESTHLRKDGSIIPVEVHGRTIESGGGKLILTVIRDITERKAAEEALRESEEKYRDLLDNTSDLIQSVKPDGRFRYVNNGWRQALGYSEEEISKLTIFDILHPDCLQNYKNLFQKVKFGEDVGWINTTFVSRNGSKIIVEGNMTGKYVNGELIYTRSIFRNITKSKYLEEQMFRLSSAVSMSTDCMVITDLDAKIIDANQKILEMYGADSKEELLGKHFLELIVPAERVKVSMDVSEIMEKGSLECQEYNMVSKQGSRFPVQMSTSLVRDADGKPMGMVRVGRELGQLN